MLLAVDTSTAQIGLALYDESQVIAEYMWQSAQRHTMELAPAISELLARCGSTVNDVRALGVALGPGSFTSLRVGLALVKGLAVARHIPLIGIPTLDILAAAQPVARHKLICSLRAGRGRHAVVRYRGSRRGWQAESPARAVTIEALIQEIEGPTLLCGEFTTEERQVLVSANPHIRLASPAHSVRRPAVLAELAWTRWQAGHTDDEASLAPIYLHMVEPTAA
ncbi:MAG TPA: tRNA (adenosine(37)-N6)-threonylcarbamoyltransferase complex dimerization subunit type 1 TsaB [Anaerolineales bacterium]|nr:tRNA (adenosine(37)-N6)-threonylcarbamoyltransferase complex dimerization subunit type 1 TsaB [Anaerolineales bacterium]